MTGSATLFETTMLGVESSSFAVSVGDGVRTKGSADGNGWRVAGGVLDSVACDVGISGLYCGSGSGLGVTAPLSLEIQASSSSSSPWSLSTTTGASPFFERRGARVILLVLPCESRDSDLEEERESVVGERAFANQQRQPKGKRR